MAQENITITLPVSGEKAVLKSFIPHKVNRKIQSIFLGRQKLPLKKDENKSESQLQQETLASIELTGEDAIEMNEIITKGLTIQIGDHYAAVEPISDVIDDMDEADYSALQKAATEVYNKFKADTDPKGSGAGNKATTKN